MNITPEEMQALKAIIESQSIEITILEKTRDLLSSDLKLFKHMLKEARKSIKLLTEALKKATSKQTSDEFVEMYGMEKLKND